MQEGVRNMSSECVSFIYLHTNPAAPSDHINLKYSRNDEPNRDYIIPILYIDHNTYCKYLFQINIFKELAIMLINIYYVPRYYLMETCKINYEL